ncbi:FAR-17a/AIG1-like protein-domain-containing protein [Lophiotrema nucula]|uniref:FAR-17a/AIG1-like protein-domain-containing protein n=1 Tax=Lophiotrema nucula TaxID=690887 RepID=A0A6A5YS51_9PLEO|nr:FAR-17a/AIG1-like protein-domain-containing protein [Lophiotrema nucula]
MSAPAAVERLRQRHPLQKFEAPSEGFSGVLHTDSYGWHFQYLTIVGLTISTLCFTCGLSADMASSSTTFGRTLFTCKNYLALVAAPIEILISILYWGLRAIDTSLVIPPDLPMLPLWADIGFHLAPALFLAADVLLCSPPWPTAPLPKNASVVTLSLSTSFAFAYWYWIELCYAHNGFYPYPIFGLLNRWQRVGLFAFAGVMMWMVGAALRFGYAALNGVEAVGRLRR